MAGYPPVGAHIGLRGASARLRVPHPLTRVQTYLHHHGQWSEAWEHELLEMCTTEVEEAIHAAEAVSHPPPQDMFRYMYADMTPALKEQEAALLALLQREG